MQVSLRKYKRSTLYSFLFLTPLALFVFVFTIAPIIKVLVLCLSYEGQFPTLSNFLYIFSHYQFLEALRNTFAVSFVGLSVELSFAFVLALFVTSNLRWKKAIRVLFLLPLGIPTIIVASNMRFFFDSSGLINRILIKVGAIETGIDWASNPFLATGAVVAADMWKVTPLVMLIFVAGIEAIPTEIVKAARVDGANYFQVVKKIFMPLLIPALNMAIIIRGIDCFRIFELPLTMFGRTFPVMSSYAYFEYIETLNEYSSSAAAVILLFMIILSLMGYLLLLRRQSHAL